LLVPQPFTIDAALNVVPCGGSGGTALGSACQLAAWGVEVDVAVHNHMPGTASAYVNLLIDWNQDGQWSGASSCSGIPSLPAPEHVLVDLPVPNPYDGPLSSLSPPPFRVGPNDGYVWARFSITERPVGPEWSGEGSFENGESEDYLLLMLPAQPTPTPTGTAGPTATPTPTATATQTARPTLTPLATATPTATEPVSATLLTFKTVDKEWARPGEELQYAVVMMNDMLGGGDPGTDVRLRDPLPASLELVPGSLDQRATYDAGTRTIYWQGQVPRGGSVEITFRALLTQAAAGLRSVINAAIVTDALGREVAATAQTQILHQTPTGVHSYVYVPVVRKRLVSAGASLHLALLPR
jgi:uncharacterized repeat protein (TIGR01451 family)